MKISLTIDYGRLEYYCQFSEKYKPIFEKTIKHLEGLGFTNTPLGLIFESADPNELKKVRTHMETIIEEFEKQTPSDYIFY